MALPQDGQNANALATVKEVPTGKKLIFVDPTTNEGGIITLEDLTTQILKKLTSQTFALDQGTKTLPAALNELNSKPFLRYEKAFGESLTIKNVRAATHGLIIIEKDCSIYEGSNDSEEYDNKEHSNIKRQDRSPVPGYPERQ